MCVCTLWFPAEFVIGNPNAVWNQAAVLKAACYRKRVDTLTATLFQLKSFSFRDPISQSQLINVNLATRPQKIISSMLVLIPLIHENKWYVNWLRPFFPFAQWTQWRTVMIHWVFYHIFYWLRTDRGTVVVFRSVQFFFASSLAMSIPHSVCTSAMNNLFRCFIVSPCMFLE